MMVTFLSVAFLTSFKIAKDIKLMLEQPEYRLTYDSIELF